MLPVLCRQRWFLYVLTFVYHRHRALWSQRICYICQCQRQFLLDTVFTSRLAEKKKAAGKRFELNFFRTSVKYPKLTRGDIWLCPPSPIIRRFDPKALAKPKRAKNRINTPFPSRSSRKRSAGVIQFNSQPFAHRNWLVYSPKRSSNHRTGSRSVCRVGSVLFPSETHRRPESQQSKAFFCILCIIWSRTRAVFFAFSGVCSISRFVGAIRRRILYHSERQRKVGIYDNSFSNTLGFRVGLSNGLNKWETRSSSNMWSSMRCDSNCGNRNVSDSFLLNSRRIVSNVYIFNWFASLKEHVWAKLGIRTGTNENLHKCVYPRHNIAWRQ